MKCTAMPTWTIRFIACLAVLAGPRLLPAAEAAKSASDPLAGAFFPPEAVLQMRDQIALTGQQRDALRARMEKTSLRSEELRAKLERETAALAAIAKQDHVDEAAIGAQLDRVLDVEREAKRVHLALLTATKNLLTPAQQSQLRKIETASKRVAQKADRVKQIAHTWTQTGRDAAFIAETMDKKIRPLAEAGKFMEVETELDRLLEQLTQTPK